MEETTEQVVDTSQAVETEKIKGELDANISFGKFKDLKSLLNGYNALESEFTKRCQKLKELEGVIEAKKMAEEKKIEKTDITDDLKEEIIKDYVEKLISNKSKAVVLDSVNGGNLVTPKVRAKNIAEAGAFAKELFNK